MKSTLVKTMLISGRNQTSVAVAGSGLCAGMYIYALISDGNLIDTKRMVLTD